MTQGDGSVMRDTLRLMLAVFLAAIIVYAVTGLLIAAWAEYVG